MKRKKLPRKQKGKVMDFDIMTTYMYEGGWRYNGKDWLMETYTVTEDEAEQLCMAFAKIELLQKEGRESYSDEQCQNITPSFEKNG